MKKTVTVYSIVKSVVTFCFKYNSISFRIVNMNMNRCSQLVANGVIRDNGQNDLKQQCKSSLNFNEVPVDNITKGAADSMTTLNYINRWMPDSCLWRGLTWLNLRFSLALNVG